MFAMFKKINTPTAIVIVISFFGMISCDNGFEEVNSNPNANPTADARYVLPYAEEAAVDLSVGGLDISNLYVQYYSNLLYASSGIYDYSPSSSNGHWSTFYINILENLNQIEIAAEETNNVNQEAIAVILKTWIAQNMTDLWGDIPYTEANLGNAPLEQKVINPKYDSQESIYEDLIVQLDHAINIIDESSSPFGSEDLIYNGDMTKWKKFATSLKLRVYMRLSEVKPGVAQAGIQEVYTAGGYFESNSDNALKPYLQYPNNHPDNEQYRLREDDKVSATVVDNLSALNDPRLRIYAAPTGQTSEIIGLPVGLEQGAGYTNSNVSPIGAYFVAPTTPGVIMTYSEVLFIFSEASARGWLDVPGKSAGDLYEEAITANMHMYSQEKLDAVLSSFPGDDTYNTLGLKESEFPSGITDQEIAEYLQQPGVAWNPSQWRELIGLQKWIKFYNQGVQGWHEWKRLNYPVLEPGRDALLDEVPKRWIYPLSEQSLNGDNLSQAVSNLNGADDLTTHVWWDQ